MEHQVKVSPNQPSLNTEFYAEVYEEAFQTYVRAFEYILDVKGVEAKINCHPLFQRLAFAERISIIDNFIALVLLKGSGRELTLRFETKQEEMVIYVKRSEWVRSSLTKVQRQLLGILQFEIKAAVLHCHHTPSTVKRLMDFIRIYCKRREKWLKKP